MAVVNLMTQAEYAKHRGCSAVAVHKAVKSKRISIIREEDGSEKIDPVVADIQWAQNTRARRPNVKEGAAAAGTPSMPDLVGQAQAPAGTEPPVPASTPTQLPDGYNAARARRESADAETAEINLKKLRGEVLLRADIDRAGFEIGRALRDAMESAVNPLAAEIAPLMSADACTEVLRKHNRAMQDLLVRAFREKIGAPAAGAAQ